MIMHNLQNCQFICFDRNEYSNKHAAILIEGSGRTPKTYDVIINKGVFVSYYYNTSSYVQNSTDIDFAQKRLYKAGEKIVLPATEYDGDHSKAYCGTVNISGGVLGSSVGNIITRAKTDQLKAIGVSYIK